MFVYFGSLCALCPVRHDCVLPSHGHLQGRRVHTRDVGDPLHEVGHVEDVPSVHKKNNAATKQQKQNLLVWILSMLLWHVMIRSKASLFHLKGVAWWFPPIILYIRLMRSRSNILRMCWYCYSNDCCKKYKSVCPLSIIASGMYLGLQSIQKLTSHDRIPLSLIGNRLQNITQPCPCVTALPYH